MKVLFICNGNVGRSPMAAALFNKLSKHGKAASAGVEVAIKGNVGKPTNIMNIKVMKEIGCDLSGHKRRQLNETMARKADVIVFMGSKRKVPTYLKRIKRVKYWKIRDPKQQTMDTRRRIRNKIKTKVEGLTGEIG